MSSACVPFRFYHRHTWTVISRNFMLMLWSAWFQREVSGYFLWQFSYCTLHFKSVWWLLLLSPGWKFHLQFQLAIQVLTHMLDCAAIFYKVGKHWSLWDAVQRGLWTGSHPHLVASVNQVDAVATTSTIMNQWKKLTKLPVHVRLWFLPLPIVCWGYCSCFGKTWCVGRQASRFLFPFLP